MVRSLSREIDFRKAKRILKELEQDDPPFSRRRPTKGEVDWAREIVALREKPYKADPLSDPESGQGANSDAGLSQT
jgi:hypothetical protein